MQEVAAKNADSQYKTKLAAASRRSASRSAQTAAGTREAKVKSCPLLAPTTQTVYEGGCCAST